MSKFSGPEMRNAAELIDIHCENARKEYAKAQEWSDQYGIPYSVPHNTYLPKEFFVLKSEYEELETGEEQKKWVEEHGFGPEDFYSEYGDAGWQSSYC